MEQPYGVFHPFGRPAQGLADPKRLVEVSHDLPAPLRSGYRRNDHAAGRPRPRGAPLRRLNGRDRRRDRQATDLRAQGHHGALLRGKPGHRTPSSPGPDPRGGYTRLDRRAPATVLLSARGVHLGGNGFVAGGRRTGLRNRLVRDGARLGQATVGVGLDPQVCSRALDRFAAGNSDGQPLWPTVLRALRTTFFNTPHQHRSAGKGRWLHPKNDERQGYVRQHLAVPDVRPKAECPAAARATA